MRKQRFIEVYQYQFRQLSAFFRMVNIVIQANELLLVFSNIIQHSHYLRGGLLPWIQLSQQELNHLRGIVVDHFEGHNIVSNLLKFVGVSGSDHASQLVHESLAMLGEVQCHQGLHMKGVWPSEQEGVAREV